MAATDGIFRQVHTTFWGDADVIDWTPEERYFYLYLMTCPSSSVCGIFELPLKIIERETGYNTDTVLKLLERFSRKNKIKYNLSTKEIAIKNWLKYRGRIENNDNMVKRLFNETANIKDYSLVLFITDLIRCMGVTYEEKDNGVERRYIAVDTDVPGQTYFDRRTLTDAGGDSGESQRAPKKSVFAKPTIEEIAAYCKERKNAVDAEHFYHHYEARDWKLTNGKRVTNWKSCVVTWEKNEKKFGGSKVSKVGLGGNDQNKDYSVPEEYQGGKW
jgi:hypothetical protein